MNLNAWGHVMEHPFRGRRPNEVVFQTARGRMLHGKAEEILATPSSARLKGKVQLVFTSPPFPLNRKKRYGNKTGDEYREWLAGFAEILVEYLTPDGSIVMELGNAWEPGSPTMSTLAVHAPHAGGTLHRFDSRAV